MRFFLIPRPLARVWQLPAAVLILLSAPEVVSAALHPAEIAASQANQAPYRYSGRVDVVFGKEEYIGTASSVRRYTGLTAGHLLYDPKTGFGINVRYEPALFYNESVPVPVSYFAVLSGYQTAADDRGTDSDTAFDLDTGYVLFAKPIASDSLAPWASDPDALMNDTDFLVLGYAAEKLTGEALAYVRHSMPYYVETPPALYEDTAYYTEGGMSGGPVYATSNGTMKILAINVAGTDPSGPAYSDARVVTADVVPLVTDAEYQHGLITGGVITGKAKITAGKSRNYSAGVTFLDGKSETVDLPAQYDELTLVAAGPNKNFATVTKVAVGAYTVGIAAGTASGTSVVLKLFRSDAKRKEQTPLKTLTITVK